VAVYWQASGKYALAGDEPHYLFIAESMFHDGDVSMQNNYDGHGVVPWDVDIVKSARGWYSVHNLGLPLVILPALLAGGALGAKLCLALLAGLFPLVAFRVFDRLLASPGRSLAATLTLALALPFLGAANQIYPDLLSGLALFYTVDYAFASLKARDSSPLRFGLTALVLAFLPWLHIKNAVPAMIIALVEVAACVTRRGDRRLWLVRPLLMLGALAVSLSLLGLYNLYAFGNAAGPYERQHVFFDLPKNAAVFLGLHFDQAQGMFLQQPLLWFALVGLWSFWKTDRHAALVWLALYGAVLAPHCLHPQWYGGHSFIGRFGVSSALLWTFPLAHGVKRLAAARGGLFWIVCGACLSLQGWMASAWLTCDGLLLAQKFNVPEWASNSLLPPLRRQLPYWHDFVNCWKYLPNYSALCLAGLLAYGGWLWSIARSRIAWTLLAVWAALATAVCKRPSEWAPLTLYCADLPGAVGRVEGEGRAANEDLDANGLLAVVPNLLFPDGDYDVGLKYVCDGESESEVGRLGVVRAAEVESWTPLKVGEDEGGEIVKTLHIEGPPSNRANILLMVFEGRGNLAVERVTIRRK
jgi:hypothetical protein